MSPATLTMRGALLALMLVPPTATPRAAEAPACVASLSPTAQQVYGMALPDLRANTVIADLLREKLRPVVMAGRMDRTTARTAAEAAGPCLQARQRDMAAGG